MKKLLTLTAVLLFWPLRTAAADPLQVNLPWGIGTVQLPYQATELLMGYDAVLKQGIGGASLPVLTLCTGKWYQLDGQLGAIGAFPVQAANVQPYLALGHDVARDIPALAQFKSLHINGFGRWDTSQGPVFKDHLGAGASASYALGGSVSAPPAATSPVVPPTSKLNLYSPVSLS